MNNDELILRKLLWLRHGCDPRGLYGDDGEMQCSICGVDFLRSSPEKMEERFMEINIPKMLKFFKESKEASPKDGGKDGH